jgi:hypothetical protein
MIVSPAFVRLVRVARITSLLALGWTMLCGAMIVGWQATSWVRDGYWPELSTSFILTVLERNAVYQTASSEKVQTSADPLLEVPAIVPILVASALLTAFYLWLLKVDRRSS